MGLPIDPINYTCVLRFLFETCRVAIAERVMLVTSWHTKHSRALLEIRPRLVGGEVTEEACRFSRFFSEFLPPVLRISRARYEGKGRLTKMMLAKVGQHKIHLIFPRTSHVHGGEARYRLVFTILPDGFRLVLYSEYILR